MTEFAVMPEGTKLLPGDRVTLVVTVPEDGSMRVRSRDEDIRVVERRVPEVVLPTEPGYYESAQYPIDKHANAYQLALRGQWYCGANRVTEERMREIMPLTRLVPETEAAPAKLIDRMDLKSLTERLRRMHADMSTTWTEDTEALIDAIDNGEFDL